MEKRFLDTAQACLTNGERLLADALVVPPVMAAKLALYDEQAIAAIVTTLLGREKLEQQVLGVMLSNCLGLKVSVQPRHDSTTTHLRYQ
jgi:hypothetical protein